MNTDTTDYRFECIVNLKFIKIIIGYIQLQWKRSRSVFILLSVIFSYSGNGLVQCSVYIIIGYIQLQWKRSRSGQCLYYYRLYSVTEETVSFRAVFILLSVIFSVAVETVSFSAVLVALKRAVGVSLQRRV